MLLNASGEQGLLLPSPPADVKLVPAGDATSQAAAAAAAAGGDKLPALAEAARDTDTTAAGRQRISPGDMTASVEFVLASETQEAIPGRQRTLLYSRHVLHFV